MAVNELERRAYAKLVAEADRLGVGDQVPADVREYAAGRLHQGNGGARAWARAHPDDTEVRVGCCIGNDINGPEYCLCWIPVFAVDQQPAQPIGPDSIRARNGMCHDCAYRPRSPERTDGERFMEDDLLDLATSGTPFWCHEGIRRPAYWEHPDGRTVPADPADYQPAMLGPIVLRADGTPANLCGGWAALTGRASKDIHPDWLLALDDLRADGTILPGGMVWADPPPLPRGGGRRRGQPNNTVLPGGLTTPASKLHARFGDAPPPPIEIREQQLTVIGAHPMRWARVYSGNNTDAVNLASWFRARRSLRKDIEATSRREGPLVNTYARLLIAGIDE